MTFLASEFLAVLVSTVPKLRAFAVLLCGRTGIVHALITANASVANAITAAGSCADFANEGEANEANLYRKLPLCGGAF